MILEEFAITVMNFEKLLSNVDDKYILGACKQRQKNLNCTSSCVQDSDCMSGHFCNCDGNCGRSCISSSESV